MLIYKYVFLCYRNSHKLSRIIKTNRWNVAQVFESHKWAWMCLLMLTMMQSWAPPDHWLLPHCSVSVKISAYFCSSSKRVICHRERYFHRSHHFHNLLTSAGDVRSRSLLDCIFFLFFRFFSGIWTDNSQHNICSALSSLTDFNVTAHSFHSDAMGIQLHSTKND